MSLPISIVHVTMVCNGFEVTCESADKFRDRQTWVARNVEDVKEIIDQLFSQGRAEGSI